MILPLLAKVAFKQSDMKLVESPSQQYSLNFVTRKRIADPGETLDTDGKIILEDRATNRSYWVIRNWTAGVTTKKYPVSFDYAASPDNRLLFMWTNGRFETTFFYVVDTKLHRSFSLLNKHFETQMRNAIAGHKGPFKSSEVSYVSFAVAEPGGEIIFHKSSFEFDWEVSMGFGTMDDRTAYYRSFYKRGNGATIELDHISAVPTPKDLK